jgi:hypothetical protein
MLERDQVRGEINKCAIIFREKQDTAGPGPLRPCHVILARF